jgi:hypothetical protein
VSHRAAGLPSFYWFLVAGSRLYLRSTTRALQEPPGHPQCGHPKRSPFDPARHSRWRGIGGQQLPVGFGVVGRGLGFCARPLPALGYGDPPADIRERFRAADRALERVVDFLAVETEAGYTKLHMATSVPPARLLRVQAGMAPSEAGDDDSEKRPRRPPTGTIRPTVNTATAKTWSTRLLPARVSAEPEKTPCHHNGVYGPWR